MAHVNRERESGKSGNGWVCPSTRAFWQEAHNTPGFSFFDLVHGYVYTRWPYLYIGLGMGEHRLSGLARWIANLLNLILPSRPNPNGGKSGVAESYHGKVVTTTAARQLVMVRENIRLPDLEQVIPYPRARDIILQNPDHIVALQCPCRSSRADPCAPLDVCLIVGEPFAGLVADHHPQRSHWIDAEEACDILEAEHARGHVHHAFFKDAMLGRFYAICNCCPCCCGAMQAMRRGTPMLASSGYVSAVDADLCIACGECATACPFAAMTLLADTASVDRKRCMGCGVCVSRCSAGAISLQRDPSKSAPLEIQKLIAQVTN